MANSPGRLRALKKKFKELEKKGIFASPGVVVRLTGATDAEVASEEARLKREHPEARYRIVINVRFVSGDGAGGLVYD